MMKQAMRHFVVRAAAAFLLAFVGVYAIATMLTRERAHSALKAALLADAANLTRSLADLRDYSGWLRPELERIEASAARLCGNGRSPHLRSTTIVRAPCALDSCRNVFSGRNPTWRK